jgi:hypothetical protein
VGGVAKQQKIILFERGIVNVKILFTERKKRKKLSLS